MRSPGELLGLFQVALLNNDPASAIYAHEILHHMAPVPSAVVEAQVDEFASLSASGDFVDHSVWVAARTALLEMYGKLEEERAAQIEARKILVGLAQDTTREADDRNIVLRERVEEVRARNAELLNQLATVVARTANQASGQVEAVIARWNDIPNAPDYHGMLVQSGLMLNDFEDVVAKIRTLSNEPTNHNSPEWNAWWESAPRYTPEEMRQAVNEARQYHLPTRS